MRVGSTPDGAVTVTMTCGDEEIKLTLSPDKATHIAHVILRRVAMVEACKLVNVDDLLRHLGVRD